jgi:protein-tyrosine kinase
MRSTKRSMKRQETEGNRRIRMPLTEEQCSERGLREKQMKLNPNDSCIVTFTDPDSPVSEQYRKLKTVLLKITRKDFRNTILVTSALSGEGKSVTCTNLAVMLAREYGQTVLLVDADLRKPSLGDYLGLTPVFGLADCLYDGVDLSKAIVKTGLPKLSFLSAGKKVDDPAELLSSQRMKDLLIELKHRYADRYIIVDTTPALLYAEALALSALVDGVLIVVKEGVATLKGVSDMLESLKGAPLLGIVYNDVSTASLDGSYSHYERYYKKNRNSDSVTK